MKKEILLISLLALCGCSNTSTSESSSSSISESSIVIESSSSIEESSSSIVESSSTVEESSSSIIESSSVEESSSSIEESSSSIVESSSTVEESSSSIIESSSVEESSSSIEESSSSEEIIPYTITFDCDENVSVYVYESQDYTKDPTLATSTYAVDGDSGEVVVDGTGQVNFKLVYSEGYALDGEIEITGDYGKLKGEADTEIKDVYRVTKIAGDLTISIKSIMTTLDAYTVTFDCDDHVSVYVYATSEYIVEPTLATFAYSVVSETGALTRDGTGQINIKLVFEEGYELDSISQDVKNYKNMKGPDETLVDNVYRFTKITGDFTLTITSKVAE